MQDPISLGRDDAMTTYLLCRRKWNNEDLTAYPFVGRPDSYPSSGAMIVFKEICEGLNYALP